MMDMPQTFRSRCYRILEGIHPPGVTGRVVDALLILLISANVIAAILETVESIYAAYGPSFDRFEIFSIAVFSIEYLVRVWVCVDDPERQDQTPLKARLRYIVSPLALIDLFAIAPVFLGLLFNVDLRWLRLFRLLRLFKLTRYWSGLNLLYRVMRDEAPTIGAALFILSIVMVLASGGIYLFENKAQPDAFGSLPEAMWWTVTTLTTVGYGDVVPVTPWSKAFGGLISLIGIGMIAFPAGILAAGFAEQVRRSQKLYRERVDEAMSEGPVTGEMVAELEEARTELGLSEDMASDIVRSEVARKDEDAYCPHCGGPLPRGDR
ncbi:MAG: ion transporter [Alphaproteobacteria bacterium]|nr:ion transporter [Alphaproteobacteria bacterium]